MSSTWWIRFVIVVFAIFWAVYTLLPSFLSESASDRLAVQASEADGSAEGRAAEIAQLRKDIRERIPAAVDLPVWLQQDIQKDLPNCKQACIDYESDAAKNSWIESYFMGKGKDMQRLCAVDALSYDQKNGCAVTALKACVKKCVDGKDHSELECAQGCLSIHNDKWDDVNPWVNTKSDWALGIAKDSNNAFFNDDERAKLDDIPVKEVWEKAFYFSFYDGVVTKEYDTCLAETSNTVLNSEACVNRRNNACTKACRDDGQEELSTRAKAILAFYPSARLSLGLDLQGGIDMDLEVELDEAVSSSVQRDLSSVVSAAEIEGINIDDVRRVRGEPALLILPSTGEGEKEATTRSEVQTFIAKRFTSETLVKYNLEGSQQVGDKEYMLFRINPEVADKIGKRAIEQALETLRSRIDETGVKEPSITKKSGGKINVQLPGIDDVQQAMSAIGTAAVLEFMLVDEDVMKQKRDLQTAIFEAEGELPPEDFLDDELLSLHLVDKGAIPSSTKLMWEYQELGEGKKERGTSYVVKNEVILTGDDINDANVAYNQYNEPYVSMEFKPKGGEIFSRITGENVNKRFAIILDKEVRSAPVIRSKISGGVASIEMGTADFQTALNDANVLSLVLRTGALPAPVTVGKVRTVGASLGVDAIEAGKRATLYGFVFVLFFMLLRYRKPGLVSVFALLTNVLLVFALLAVAGATLTLPGIAGIALTIGMAVDCNIIIYERIIEERDHGKPERSAVGTGFDKAFLAVLDANITTFIAGVVLYTYGTGPIKGFAVTLMIGILTTLFTGVFLSRTIIDFFTRKTSTSRFF